VVQCGSDWSLDSSWFSVGQIGLLTVCGSVWVRLVSWPFVVQLDLLALCGVFAVFLCLYNLHGAIRKKSYRFSSRFYFLVLRNFAIHIFIYPLCL
jgi:hypothetical protein